jgi:ATP-dependent Clp protease, protease subunit
MAAIESNPGFVPTESGSTTPSTSSPATQAAEPAIALQNESMPKIPGNIPVAFDANFAPRDNIPYSPVDAGVEPTNLMVPMIRERDRFGDTVSDLFSRIYDDGTIFLTGPIEDGMATLVTAQLLYWQAKDPKKEITIHLNSPGGVVTSGFSIYDTMQQVKNPICIVVSGQAASMGATLLSGGTKGRRFAQPNASIMIHSVRGGTGGIAADIESQGRRLVSLNQRLTKIIADNCGQPYAKVFEDMRQDHFMNAEEALEYGIIDGILKPDGSVLTLAQHKKNKLN